MHLPILRNLPILGDFPLCTAGHERVKLQFSLWVCPRSFHGPFTVSEYVFFVCKCLCSGKSRGRHYIHKLYRIFDLLLHGTWLSLYSESGLDLSLSVRRQQVPVAARSKNIFQLALFESRRVTVGPDCVRVLFRLFRAVIECNVYTDHCLT